MKDQKNRRRKHRRLKGLLFSPFYALMNILVSIKDAGEAILQAVGLKGRIVRRRNRDFERAGRETPRVDGYDSQALSNLEKADRIRDQEILNQVIYENRTLRKKNKEGEALRRNMIEENLSVSQGDAISHLAKMNAKEKERKKKAKEAKEESAELNSDDSGDVND